MEAKEKFHCRVSDIPKCDNYVDFINKFIELNPVTYYDSNPNMIQCFNINSSRRRSFSDIYIITKERYPEVTLEQVVIAIAKYIIPDKYKIITYCGGINKLVIARISNSSAYLGKTFENQFIYRGVGNVAHSSDGITTEQVIKILDDARILL
jgi:hypothetical protein